MDGARGFIWLCTSRPSAPTPKVAEPRTSTSAGTDSQRMDLLDPKGVLQLHLEEERAARFSCENASAATSPQLMSSCLHSRNSGRDP